MQASVPINQPTPEEAAILQSLFEQDDSNNGTTASACVSSSVSTVSTVKPDWKNKILDELKIKNYLELSISDELLGQGAFSTVFRGTWRGNTVAIKHFPKASQYTEQENEILVMKHLGSYPTIISSYGYTMTPHGFNIVLELAPYGSFSQLLYNKLAFPDTTIFPTPLIIAWFCDMTDAISYLHSKGIKHKDIKAENFLVFSMFRLKLGGFGLASESMLGGTPIFIAPEIITNQTCVYSSDVYSFAVTAVQVMIRKTPDSNVSMDEQVFDAVANLPALTDEQRQDLSTTLFNCLHTDPLLRSTAIDLNRFLKKLLGYTSVTNTSDPRTENHPIYGTIRGLENDYIKHMNTTTLPTTTTAVGGSDTGSRSNKHGMTIALTDLTSEQAIGLLIHLGCCPDLEEKIATHGITVDGRYLALLDQVEILQDLEYNHKLVRRPILIRILERLQEYKLYGIDKEVMDVLCQTCTSSAASTSSSAKRSRMDSLDMPIWSDAHGLQYTGIAVPPVSPVYLPDLAVSSGSQNEGTGNGDWTSAEDDIIICMQNAVNDPSFHLTMHWLNNPDNVNCKLTRSIEETIARYQYLCDSGRKDERLKDKRMEKSISKLIKSFERSVSNK